MKQFRELSRFRRPRDKKQINGDTCEHNGQTDKSIDWRLIYRKYDQENAADQENDWENQIDLKRTMKLFGRHLVSQIDQSGGGHADG